MNKRISLLVLIFLSLLFSYGCQKDEKVSKNSKNHEHNHQQVKSYYTCSMHPQIKESKPGKCPICHMNLTKVEVDEDDDTQSSHESHVQVEKDLWQCENFPDVTSEVEGVCPMDGTPMVKKAKENKAGKVIGNVKLRKSQLNHFKPNFFPVTTMKINKKIRLLNSILQSKNKKNNIPTQINKKIEKIYIQSTNNFIKKKKPIINLYSPKLITTKKKYLITKKSYQKSHTHKFQNILKQNKIKLTQ